MEDLLAEFVAETREMLETLAGEIVAWEADPADRARLDAVFRFVHTVKGNCGFFDFPRLAALSHAAEDALSDVRSGERAAEPALVSAVLAIIDRIAAMADAIEAGEEFPEGGDEALIAALSAEPAATLAEPEPEPVAPSEPEPGTRPQQGGNQRTIRLSVDLLDRVMSGVSDMAVARNLLARRLREIGDPALDAHFNRLSGLLNDVRDAITRTRMQRIDMLFAAFPRVVRDLSAELGKQVLVDIESGAVEIDREMLDLIRDPLIHIIRNAIDHGIERPAERRAAGKHEIGTLSISARQTGNVIRIGIADDGRGIDAERLIAKAVAAGIVTPERAARLTRQERFGLICEPGLSTRDEATAVSGRGVGMDVVRANIERFGGSLFIFSTLGSGTRFVIDVPLTLSIVPSLTVGVAGQKFAITRSYVGEIVRAGADGVAMADLGGIAHIVLRDRRIPCFALRKVLRIDDSQVEPGQVLVVLTLVGGDSFALAVDDVFDHEELVIKPIAPAVMATGFYVGATQMDDGRPVLMLDVAGIAREVGVLSQARDKIGGAAVAPVAEIEAPRFQVLLFAGLDGRRLAMPMAPVSRVEEVDPAAIRLDAQAAQVAIDGALYPLAGVHSGELPAGRVGLFRLGDGRGELAYAFREVIDIAWVDGDMARDPAGVQAARVALIDGKPTELVDCHALFARHGRASVPAEPPICRLPSGDSWFQDFLRPLVESAGYRVIGEADETEADLAILAQEGEDAPQPQAARAIRLRTTPDAGPDRADTIYRYDREALLAALRTARGRAGA
jgi:two-component system chemotaxis sensor kinase CheA